MRLRRLELVDFRNFANTSVPFGPGFTVLHGQNGAGKTNILEALYLLSTLRSFRGAEFKSMLKRDCAAAQVSLQAFDPALGVPTQLSVRIDRGQRATRRTARIDQKLVRAASDFYGRVQAVLFTPEDLNILRGSPKGRRQFLDRVLFARDRSHISDVTTYEKLLRSRNRLLKDAGGRMPDLGFLETYEAGLAEYGGNIIHRRARLVADIGPGFQRAFAQIHDSPAATALDEGASARLACTLRYRANIIEQDPESAPLDASLETLQASFSRALVNARPKDVARGTTSVGPHRDDLEVQLDESPAIHFASQGQTRALVLAFKIAELRQSRELTGQAPLLLLDDVSSELDAERNARLFAALALEVGQCVLTTTSPDYIRLPAEVERLDLQVVAGRIEAPALADPA